jgi:hypothetical protein
MLFFYILSEWIIVVLLRLSHFAARSWQEQLNIIKYKTFMCSMNQDKLDGCYLFCYHWLNIVDTCFNHIVQSACHNHLIEMSVTCTCVHYLWILKHFLCTRIVCHFHWTPLFSIAFVLEILVRYFVVTDIHRSPFQEAGCGVFDWDKEKMAL